LKPGGFKVWVNWIRELVQPHHAQRQHAGRAVSVSWKVLAQGGGGGHHAGVNGRDVLRRGALRIVLEVAVQVEFGSKNSENRLFTS
jgi:hypothetical protein